MRYALLTVTATFALLGCRPSASTSPAPPDEASSATEGSTAGAAPVEPAAAASAPPSADGAPAEAVVLDFDARVAASDPLAPVTSPQTIADMTLVATPCVFEGYTFVDDSSMDVIGAFEVVGDFAYIIDRESNLRRFTLANGGGCTFVADTGFGRGGVLDLERDIETVSSSADGTLVVSNGVFESWAIDGATGALLATCDARSHGYITLHPTGAFGLGRYLGPELQRVVFTAQGCTSEPWPWTHPFHGVSALGFVGDRIVVGGPVVDEVNGRRPQLLVAFDGDGSELWRQGNTDRSFADDGYGWFHAIEPCPWGVCVLDSNFRSLHIVSAADGTHIGRVDLSALLGLRYAWYADLDVVGDTLWLVAGQERGDSDVYEGIMYRIVEQADPAGAAVGATDGSGAQRPATAGDGAVEEGTLPLEELTDGR